MQNLEVEQGFPEELTQTTKLEVVALYKIKS
jgi:hypothetical protein